MKQFLFIFLSLVLLACSEGNQSEQSAKQAAEHFCKAFFEYDLTTAYDLCAHESQSWLQFVATNVSQADLDVVNAQEDGPEVSVGNVRLLNEKTATADVSVSNFVSMDSLGHMAHLVNEAEYRLTLVVEDGTWKVRAEGLR